ncbi:MAG: glycosyltransferase family 4 protein [Muribaculaceae bacterium]|nr:glycosyltransferase family 4 protein [Muribaculaceae bacterium]
MNYNVFHIVSDKVWTGTCQQVYDLVSKMRHDDRFYVEVVCKKHDAVLKHFRRLEVPVSILPLKGLTDIDSPVRLAEMLRTGRNVVHVHNFSDAFLAVWARRISGNRNTRVIATIHTISKPRSNYLFNRIYRALDGVVFVSDLTSRHYLEACPRLNPEKCRVIRDSVFWPEPMPDAPAVPDLRHQLDLLPGQALLMYHGRVNHDKGVDVLLRAVTQLDKSSYHLMILGEGQPKFMSQIKAFIVANQLLRNVTLAGFKEQVLRHIEQCDIGIVPSVMPEAMGLSCLEYMMCGKALITTGNGAQREYIRHRENGVLVPPDNYKAIASALKVLIDNPDLRAEMGQRAAEDFDNSLAYDRYYTDMTDLYLR